MDMKTKPNNFLLTGFYVVAPMTACVGEPINIKIKALSSNRVIGSSAFTWSFPRLVSPANTSVRGTEYIDNVPEWTGTVQIEGENLSGPKHICFNGTDQGAFPGDARAIKKCAGWSFNKPGVYFITATDNDSDIRGVSNPIIVTKGIPNQRVYWGDIHWQSFFTDGLRFPEELYDFARDEAFLDFGAASDHAEGLSDRQWEYFKSVTNDYNSDGEFATLIGFEWTHSGIGHRNIYYPGNDGPIFRSGDARFNDLDKLFNALNDNEALAIPHHSSSADMGVNWELGWNPKYEKSVEIVSSWGSSECGAESGNPCPITVMKGEKKGQHVIDALNKGYKFGFIGSGDIHDGRPGDSLHQYQKTAGYSLLYKQGLAAVYAPQLNRRNIYDAVKNRYTYAANTRNIYVDMKIDGAIIGSDVKAAPSHTIKLCVASTNPLIDIKLIGSNGVIHDFKPKKNTNVYNFKDSITINSKFCYLRVSAKNNDMAWVSPFYFYA